MKAPHFDAIIIGAGVSGMYMLHRLRESGLTTRVYEAGGGVGGTWYWNRYPGARCDTDAYLYCYTFDKDLLQEWDWSGRYPGQQEILSYLEHVADRFDLRRDIQFNTRVTGARFRESDGTWDVRVDNGGRVTARFLITALGCLSAAQMPDIKGRERFAGASYHTSAWPHESVDFRHKRVGVIGTGSTGVQAIPVIAAEADHLYVFQRTANYSVPARHERVDCQVLRDVKDRYEEIWNKCRTTTAGYPIDPSPMSVLQLSEAERRAHYEQWWAEGGFVHVYIFDDIWLDRRANDTAAEFIRAKIRATVKDPDTAEKLTPFDHPFGSKRPLIDTHYFETYNRNNVTLIDIRHAPIAEITSTGIQTVDDHYELDIIIFATGFDAMTGAYNRIDIRGRGGVALKAKWSNGPRAYLGHAVAGFPNLFMVAGPGSDAPLTNYPLCIEGHCNWIAGAIAHAQECGTGTIEAEADAEDAWVNHVRELAEPTLYMQADSWHLGANVPGKPRMFPMYLGGLAAFRAKCDEIAAGGYKGFLVQSVLPRHSGEGDRQNG